MGKRTLQTTSVIIPDDTEPMLNVDKEYGEESEYNCWILDGETVEQDGGRVDLLCALQRVDDLLSGRLIKDDGSPAPAGRVIGWTKQTVRSAIKRATKEA